jgi:putative flippase GtrA
MSFIHRPRAGLHAASTANARFATAKKAVSFALIGVLNSGVDAGIFFLVYYYLNRTPSALWPLAALADLCHCGSVANLMLVTANVIAWLVAASGSYVMNSSITFAAESGRKLTRRAYLTFLASGVVGVVANTATLVLVAQVLPVWVAKACAILVSFIVNFALSHFVVFRPMRAPEAGE